MSFHAARSGDYDSLLTLFLLIQALSCFYFLETKKNKFMYLFFISSILAVITKSIAGLLFFPAFVIYIVYRKEVSNLILNKHFYFGLFLFLATCSFYYFYRETLNPGYLKAVAQNELGGHFLVDQDNNKRPFFYYIKNFIQVRISNWLLIIPLGIAVGLSSQKKIIQSITLFSILICSSFLIIISLAKTKLSWYDLPMYPFITLIIGIGFNWIFEKLKKFNFTNTNHLFFKVLFLLTIFIFPYTLTSKRLIFAEKSREVNLSSYLKAAVENNKNINDYYIINPGYEPQNLFYINILKDRKININYKKWNTLNADDIVFFDKIKIKDSIENNYKYSFIEKFGNVYTYRIKQKLDFKEF